MLVDQCHRHADGTSAGVAVSAPAVAEVHLQYAHRVVDPTDRWLAHVGWVTRRPTGVAAGDAANGEHHGARCSGNPWRAADEPNAHTTIELRQLSGSQSIGHVRRR